MYDDSDWGGLQKHPAYGNELPPVHFPSGIGTWAAADERGSTLPVKPSRKQNALAGKPESTNLD